MKRILLILSAVFCFASTHAQTYLSDGDYVTIRMTKDYGNVVSGNRYLEASTSGIRFTESVNDNCLLQMEIVNGDYRFRDVSTGMYLKANNNNTNQGTLILSNESNASLFKFNDKGSVQGQYMSGQIYYNATAWGSMIVLYLGDQFGVAGWYDTFEFCIEKWEKVGGGDATAHLDPEKVVFEYAADDDIASKQNTLVKFGLDVSSESYYKCVCREEMYLHRQTTGLDPGKVENVQVSWLRSSNLESKIDLSEYTARDKGETDKRTLMTLSEVSKSGDDWQFTITPNGKSPMGLKQKVLKETVNGEEVYTVEYVDYVDWAVVSYKYNGKDFTQQLRVVRKAYHEDKLPTLVFSINPLTYTFAHLEEEKEFEVTAIHQHGSVIYSAEKIAIGDPVYEEGYGPESVQLSSENLELSLDNNWNGELTAILSDGKIKVTAKENTIKAKRSAILTGKLCPQKEADHPCETFTINLHQRYEDIGGIKLVHQAGKGNTALGKNPYDNRDEQQVHTAERTIYYYNDINAIELRLPESGYSGYMRWYDYKTNGAPNYNHCHNGMISTAWDLAPQSASGQDFAAINTPANSSTVDTEGYSLGLYALNQSARGNDGNSLTAAILNEDQNDNPAPRIRPWSDNGYHIMACDVSAYTDYEVVVENRQIKSITEPTLSYRQLFHMYPASVMAEKMMAKSEASEFLETYSYQAPAGKQILLATEYRFQKYRSHISEMCYFYKDKTGTIKRITNETPVVWTEYTLQNDGTYGEGSTFTPNYTAALDYLIVQENNYPVQKKYTLTVSAANANTTKDLLIASFEVKFQDIEKYGPTEKVIITQQRIENDYDVLATINFDNYNSEDQHLPWDYTSYGYVYDVDPLNTDAGFKRGASQGVFPFYGEYTVLETVNKDWAKSDAHSGSALYVDGTMEPGLVATIAAPTNICSGQTVYCSAWFRNPRPRNDWAAGGNTANPIFRCNIQGKSENGNWEDAGVYFVGELAIGTNWQQVVFPIETANSYDSTRVSIYNFATTNQGNDFMVDDINLYVSLLPIAAYQGKMACRSTSDSVTNAAAILRLDYSNINAGADGYMYYQIFNETFTKENNDTVGFPVNLTGDAAYYHDYDDEHGNNDHNHPYGSVHIPAVDFNPETYNDSLLSKDAYRTDTLPWYYSVSKILDNMVEKNLRHEKAYVKTENDGAVKWLLYVAHLIENTDSLHRALEKLYDSHTYVMRMAYTPEELPTAECNLTTPLHATQQTVFKLRNSNKATIMHSQNGNFLSADNEGDIEYIFYNSLRNCPNDLYFLTPTIVNHLAVDGAGTPAENIAAPVFADWLVGDPKGDVLSEIPPVDNQEELAEYNSRLQASIKGFEDTYGYTHGQVSHAIMYDMRRLPTEKEPNPNYYARTFEELQPMAFESQQNYEIIKHLYENEWLQLYDTAVHFYLGANDTARYWCFPIAETAKATVTVGGKETAITLKDCNEPHRVYITSADSKYFINIAPITKAAMTSQQKKQLPTVMAIAGTLDAVRIPVREISTGENKIQVGSTVYAPDDVITLNLAGDLPTYVKFVDLAAGTLLKSKPELRPGTEHAVRLQLSTDKSVDGCGVGYVFFKLQILPATMIWSPAGTSFNGWGKNENWKGWSDTNKDGKVQSTELSEGFVPTEDVNVVISNLNDPLLYPYIVPEHEHNHYEMTVGFQPHHCKHIYFESGARIHNQHLLEYDSAFVDMSIKQGEWTMVAAPLQSVYSGDMYIPHSGTHYADASASSLESTDPFTVKPFSGVRTSDAPFAFWASYYNKTVQTWYDDGQGIDIKSTSAEFVSSNSMREALDPGSGFMLLGFGPDNYTADSLTIRLPKSESVHYDSGGNRHDVPRNGVGHKLAFLADHDTDNMQITLSNKIKSQYFLFGNPTMAYINMHDFLHDNEYLKNDNGDSTQILNHVFYRIENDKWDALVEHTMGDDRFLAPMTSVMLEAASPEAQELTLTLKASHLTLNNQVSPFTEDNPEVTPAALPKRAPASAIASELMTIYAITEDATARTVLAINPAANDYYVKGEDAILISSGIENSSIVTTPLNMYTLAEQVPMMADVRQGISDIPLSVLVDESYRTNYMQLAFYYSANWSRTCYFCDSYTGQKIRIMDGLIISVEMPQNHEPRYYIEGPDMYQGGSEGGVTTSTTNPSADSQAEASFVAYSPSSSILNISCTHLIKEVVIYDLSGRTIVQQPLDLLHSSVSLPAPSGICVVKLVLRDGTALYQQALVK